MVYANQAGTCFRINSKIFKCIAIKHHGNTASTDQRAKRGHAERIPHFFAVASDSPSFFSGKSSGNVNVPVFLQNEWQRSGWTPYQSDEGYLIIGLLVEDTSQRRLLALSWKLLPSKRNCQVPSTFLVEM